MCDPFLSPREEILEPQNSLFDRGTSEFFPPGEVTSFSGNECAPDGNSRPEIKCEPVLLSHSRRIIFLVACEMFLMRTTICLKPAIFFLFQSGSPHPRFPLWGKRRRRRLNFDRTVLLPWENDVSRRRVLMIQLPRRGVRGEKNPSLALGPPQKQSSLTHVPSFSPKLPTHSTCPEKERRRKIETFIFTARGKPWEVKGKM